MGLTIVRKDGTRITARPKKRGPMNGPANVETAFGDRELLGTKLTDEQKKIANALRGMTREQRKNINSLLMPRMVQEFMPHVPHPPQQIFMGLNNRETLYGGSAGSGKSDALLMSAAQYIDVPGYSALILRRTYADLVLPGAIMDRAAAWWRGTRAKPIDGGRSWRFPSGARVTFGYLQGGQDKFRYASSEHQFIAFDELTQFLEDDYSFLFSRIRKPRLVCMVCENKIIRSSVGTWRHVSSVAGCDRAIPDSTALAEYSGAPDGTRIFDVPLRMRSASNPGGRGNNWVRDRFVNPDTRYPGALFVPAKLSDNPSLDKQEYEQSLSHLSVYDRQRLLAGDWNVTEDGDMFQRHWWGACDISEVPPDAKTVRFWDLAASKDGDWTVGAKLAEKDGRFWVVDIVRIQNTPFEVERTVKRTAMQDGTHTKIYIEQEPGSSGVALIDHYRRNVLPGFYVKPDRPSKDKVTRATPFSGAVEAGNVKLVIAKWTSAFMDECGLFPASDHDDQVDAASGAYRMLSKNAGTRIIV